MKSRLIMFLISIFCLVFIVGLVRSIYALWQKKGIVVEAEHARDTLKAENERLTEELKQAQSPEFIERAAREKLNLQREGEVVVVLPKNLASPQSQIEVQETSPNWRRWLELFF